MINFAEPVVATPGRALLRVWGVRVINELYLVNGLH
jgi:hypothetical protein